MGPILVRLNDILADILSKVGDLPLGHLTGRSSRASREQARGGMEGGKSGQEGAGSMWGVPLATATSESLNEPPCLLPALSGASDVQVESKGMVEKVACESLQRCVQALLQVLLDGGSARVFTADDAALIYEDVESELRVRASSAVGPSQGGVQWRGTERRKGVAGEESRIGKGGQGNGECSWRKMEERGCNLDVLSCHPLALPLSAEGHCSVLPASRGDGQTAASHFEFCAPDTGRTFATV